MLSRRPVARSQTASAEHLAMPRWEQSTLGAFIPQSARSKGATYLRSTFVSNTQGASAPKVMRAITTAEGPTKSSVPSPRPAVTLSANSRPLSGSSEPSTTGSTASSHSALRASISAAHTFPPTAVKWTRRMRSSSAVSKVPLLAEQRRPSYMSTVSAAVPKPSPLRRNPVIPTATTTLTLLSNSSNRRVRSVGPEPPQVSNERETDIRRPRRSRVPSVTAEANRPRHDRLYLSGQVVAITNLLGTVAPERAAPAIIMPSGLNDKRLALLPITTYAGTKQRMADHTQCMICLEDFRSGETLRWMPCLHHFHCQCIDLWLRSARTCPICKCDVEHAQSPLMSKLTEHSPSPRVYTRAALHTAESSASRARWQTVPHSQDEYMMMPGATLVISPRSRPLRRPPQPNAIVALRRTARFFPQEVS